MDIWVDRTPENYKKLNNLISAKKASGRNKGLDDLENLNNDIN